MKTDDTQPPSPTVELRPTPDKIGSLLFIGEQQITGFGDGGEMRSGFDTPRKFADRFPAMWTLHADRCELHVHGRDAFAKLEVYPISDDKCSAAIHADGAIVAGCTGPILATIGTVLAYAISKNPKVIDLTKIPPWAFKATRAAIGVYRQELEEIETHLEWSDNEPDRATDNDDAPNPVADWTPDCDGRVPNQRLIRLGKAFVELREGVLSEGQLAQMTGLDRLKVREIDDLFNQAVTGLEEAMADVAPSPTAPTEPSTGGGARLVYIALDCGDVAAIGNTKEEARASAVEKRCYFRKQMQETDGYLVDVAAGDEKWSASLAYITLSGTVENLRLLIAQNEELNMTPPWCPRDLWDTDDAVEVKL